MDKIALCFGHADEQAFVLHYRVRETNAAKAWLGLLRANIEQGVPFYQPPRFRGFRAADEDAADVLDKTKSIYIALAKIFGGVFPPRPQSVQTPQELFNYLHLVFETLRGGIGSPSPHYTSADHETRALIEELNERIHYLEILAMRNSGLLRADIKIVYQTDAMVPLSDTDCKDFRVHRDFGSICLHYSQVGKPWLDVFADQDEFVTAENIRPLQVISGNVHVHFWQASQAWADEFTRRLTNWLQNKGVNAADERLALGYLQVADLDRTHTSLEGLSDEEIVAAIGKSPHLREIKVLSGY